MKGSDFIVAKYKKKPVIIDAEIYRYGLEDGFRCLAYGKREESECKFNCGNGKEYRDKCQKEERAIPYIKTLEGNHMITKGDYIITGVKGERYPCKSDIFEMTYEIVED